MELFCPINCKNNTIIRFKSKNNHKEAFYRKGAPAEIQSGLYLAGEYPKTSSKKRPLCGDDPHLEGVQADAGKVLQNFTGALHAERGLDHVHIELECSITHVVKNIDGELPLLLALPDLVDQEGYLLRVFHPELGQADDAHVNAGQVPVRARNGFKETSDDLGLKDLAAHDTIR